MSAAAGERSAAHPPAVGERGLGAERGGIQSLERAAALLEAAARRPEGLGLGELAAAAGLHTSTAFHLARTLVRLGYLDQEPESRLYRIGSRLFVLAAAALDEARLVAIGGPILERLARETGATAHLAVRSRAEIVVVAKAAAPGLLQLAERPGGTRPAHATAIGKVLLAALPSKEREALVRSLPLEAFTTATITEPAQLLAELEVVAREGVAFDRGELDPEIRCVAVAVHDFAGRAAAALGLSGPAFRLADEALARLVVPLEAAVRELSAALGHSAARRAGERDSGPGPNRSASGTGSKPRRAGSARSAATTARSSAATAVAAAERRSGESV